jgi:outer membrane lipopolysaccharide assembly protein LptE/RlpB
LSFPSRSIFVVLLSLLVSGCGYQLRGSNLGDLLAISFSGTREAPVTFRAIRDTLEESNVTIVAPANDVVAVHLLGERSMRRSVATTDVIDAAEYELRLELDVSITRNEEVLLEQATLVAERVYAVDSANLSGSFEEQTLLMDEMRAELARKLARQIEMVAGSG